MTRYSARSPGTLEECRVVIDNLWLFLCQEIACMLNVIGKETEFWNIF